MNEDIKILIIEDEDSIRKFIKINLLRSNFNVYEAENGEIGLKLASEINPNIVVLDVMMPGRNGYEVCSILRQTQPNIGIIMLTAKTQDIDKIVGLEHGADDYMVKPFNPKELILRIESLKRRVLSSENENTTKSENIIIHPPFKLNLYSRELYKNENLIDLTPTELSIITIFLQNPGRAFTREELLNRTWGENHYGESKIIDVNIRRLRSKIEDIPSKPEYIETVWGTGYRFK